MSDYEVDRIEKPPFFGIRPTKRGRGTREPFVVGFDSESQDSQAFLMQFNETGMTEDETIVIDVPAVENRAMETFMTYVSTRLLGKFGRKHEVIIYGWNLPYEWTQLFHDRPNIATKDQPSFYLDAVDPETGDVYETYKWTVYLDKRVFAKIEHESSHLLIRVLDGMMFYKTSLDKGAKMIGYEEGKYHGEANCTRPGPWHESGHARDQITRDLATDDEFLHYARRDAYLTRMIGEQIVGLHEEYDIPQTISAPHFASSVFKRQFLTTGIALPDTPLEQAGLWSYHGGKNGFYLPGPARIESCYAYDITSAYPEAMRQLPNPELAQFDHVDMYRPGRHAIYAVTLRYTRCPWRGMLNHDGTWPESGYIEDICLTSYELDAMVERGEAEVITCHGWEMVGPSGGALMRFVDTFFAQKARSEGVERETAKLLLNSLYGKFFQKVALGDVGTYDWESGEFIEHNPEGMYDYRAGGLYHPPIASLITGFVRAKMHGMEHKYGSIMTSTDGMFGTEPPDDTDIGKHLGGLTVEHGSLDIWRERMYVFTPDDGKRKIAYHGFWGSLDQMLAIPLTSGTYEYTVHGHMITLKESRNEYDGTRYEPGSFIEKRQHITI